MLFLKNLNYLFWFFWPTPGSTYGLLWALLSGLTLSVSGDHMGCQG